LCPPETAQQLQQLIPNVVIQQAHETLLQAQQDLVLLAAVTPGMPKAAAVPSGAALVRAATHIPSNATPAMMWTQAQAQAMQQQQQQQQVQAQQQQMQVVLVAMLASLPGTAASTLCTFPTEHAGRGVEGGSCVADVVPVPSVIDTRVVCVLDNRHTCSVRVEWYTHV